MVAMRLVTGARRGWRLELNWSVLVWGGDDVARKASTITSLVSSLHKGCVWQERWISTEQKWKNAQGVSLAGVQVLRGLLLNPLDGSAVWELVLVQTLTAGLPEWCKSKQMGESKTRSTFLYNTDNSEQQKKTTSFLLLRENKSVDYPGH